MMVNINISKILTRTSKYPCHVKQWPTLPSAEVILISDKDKIDALKGAKLQDQIDAYRLPFLN